MAETAKSIGVQDLAQSVTNGVLRALSAQSEFKVFLSKGGPGLVVRPFITAGGVLYFGEAARLASAQGSSSHQIEGI